MNKCCYRTCVCGNRDIAEGDEIVERGKYYHKKCYQTKEDILEIIDVFSKEVNEDVVFAKLQSVITNIIFRKCIDSDYLLFGLKYYLKHNIPLRYPEGLYYVIQNRDVKSEYTKIEARKIKKKMLEDMANKPVDNTPQTFSYVHKKKKTITDLLGD